MAPVALTLPELERLGHDSVASPEVRPFENQFSRLDFLDRLVDAAELDEQHLPARLCRLAGACFAASRTRRPGS